VCGIFGILNLHDQRLLDEMRFSSALAMLRHRGPDAQKYRIVDGYAILGHTRLAIIDLSRESDQPFGANGQYWMVYNGEVFNYMELRQELEKSGVRFHTSGDTEVVLQSYIRWGAECLHRFNGMWALAIYDTEQRTLFCARDRFGIKPFNYVIDNGQFLFASEIKAILAYRPELAKPDYNAIANYCRTSVGAQNEQTWFRNIKRLLPGHSLTIRNGQIEIKRYWSYPSTIDRSLSFDDARVQYAELFKDAVSLRMRSDVPLGLTLSSGIDSTSIAYAMNSADKAPHHSFTSAFPDGVKIDDSIYANGGVIDESIIAGQVANDLGFQSHIVITSPSDVVGTLSRAIWHLESGHSSPAIIPLMQLMAVASSEVKVLLEGQGADELLGGYILNAIIPTAIDLILKGHIKDALDELNYYRETYKLSYAIKMTLREISNNFDFFIKAYQWKEGINNVFGPLLCGHKRTKDYITTNREGTRGFLACSLLRQHSGGLVNLLHYGDAISMAHSLEARLPFMDYRLVEFVWRLPPEYKVSKGKGKVLHREAMRGLVPDYILDQKRKYGYVTPVSQWFRDNRIDDNALIGILLSKRCLERGLFDKKGLENIITVHRDRKKDHGPLLFRLLSTEIWFRKFIDNPQL